MSNLPEVDSEKIEQKLLFRLADQIKQNIRLETLAEALRDERDNARLERDHYQSKVMQMLDDQMTAAEDTEGE